MLKPVLNWCRRRGTQFYEPRLHRLCPKCRELRVRAPHAPGGMLAKDASGDL